MKSIRSILSKLLQINTGTTDTGTANTSTADTSTANSSAATSSLKPEVYKRLQPDKDETLNETLISSATSDVLVKPVPLPSLPLYDEHFCEFVEGKRFSNNKTGMTICVSPPAKSLSSCCNGIKSSSFKMVGASLWSLGVVWELPNL